ncbi:protein FpvR [Alcaligenes pakistanensis]|uniref:Protein FpvR n=2 Tax=Alcaligenes pakistanensis TaxID=1482717 RepID=A0A8H9IL31_9BURK|nr:protein FpvR [Alcaligenes pakistanensis]
MSNACPLLFLDIDHGVYMHLSPDHTVPDDPRAAAAFWLSKSSLRPLSDQEQQALQDWLQNAAHRHEYELMKGVWNATALVPAERLRALAKDPQTPPRRQGLGWSGGLALGAVVCITVALTQFEFNPEQAWHEANYSSAVGEIRRVTLPDQSVITLNTDTRLQVRYFAHRREIALLRGQALFEVQSDRAQPFDVQAGDTQVRVTGTRFDVLYLPEQTQVTVQSGSVRVRQGAWWWRQQVDLHADQQISLSPQITELKAQTADVQSALSWEQGTLIYKNVRLDQAIAQINRYRTKPITLSQASLGAIRIGGTVPIARTQDFLDTLPRIAAVRVEHQVNGEALILPK